MASLPHRQMVLCNQDRRVIFHSAKDKDFSTFDVSSTQSRMCEVLKKVNSLYFFKLKMG
jgi:hypothetical protein